MSRIHSPTYREKRKKRVIRWSIFGTVLALAIIGGSIYWAHNYRFVIAAVNVSGASFSDPLAIKAVAVEDMSGDYLFAYPKTNEFLYPKNKIEAAILADSPAVQSVSLALNKGVPSQGPALGIQIKERIPFVLWCGDDVQASSSQCYFADSDGYIFSGAPHFSGDLYPVFYGGLGEATGTVPMASTSPDAASTDAASSAAANAIRNSILTPSRFAQIMSFAKDVAPLGFQVTSYQVTEDPSGDICDLYYGTSTDSYLRVNCDDDFSDVAANLESFISDPHFSTSTPAGYQYIDLRFGDKIVYKRK